ncbi:hypothetical protein Lesp01_84060 [Lentzea sp. NBRC 102530]|nr:hypothetical protein Lesp01_84060 [Lentzea sp. NBRC 102530]
MGRESYSASTGSTTGFSTQVRASTGTSGEAGDPALSEASSRRRTKTYIRAAPNVKDSTHSPKTIPTAPAIAKAPS